MPTDLTEIKGYNLKLFQNKKGYRFSIDSFLLAWFVAGEEFSKGLEIGAGSGIVSLLIERMTEDKKHFELIEVQKSLFNLLKKNIDLNKPYKSKFVLRNEDARFVLPSVIPDIVYSNPPFTDFSKGKVSPNFEKAIARHTYLLNLESLLKWYIENTGQNTKLAFVETIKNLEYYREKVEEFSLFVEKIVYVKPFENKNPNLFLILINKKKKDFEEQYLTIYKSKNIYTDKVKQILGIV
ncbi:tRNA1Val (adenine37-N6)-methyltransferase [Thermotomaculum hydrothermale]|uniref:tRNA1Val (Adenine37-N6)-methyltransferase n=1 Tax=Thermotomaculum hydrothermale TaxID=981385 RepID=A0A7R6SYY3_9BACT|nr:RsmD family RNA methyltransferase [Thermotomaculum hydrothermale]BBB32207.1 tRNA1Val (adenine37-N6)-methyltransferase [Thermotomaculum hydrothermale]